eukprot:gene10430-8986_t
MQRALDRLRRWAEEMKLEVSLDKTEFVVFCPRPQEARGYAADAPPVVLRYGKTPLKYNKEPVFLGVVFDERLTFLPHIRRVQSAMIARNKVAKALGGSNWGCPRRTVKMVHTAYTQAKADYCLGVYGTLACPREFAVLETQQHEAASIISGCTRDSLNPVRLREADLQPLRVRARAAAATAREKLLRLPHDVPAGRGARAGDPPAVKRAAVHETLALRPEPDLEAWTDGSAKAGVRDGGAGAAVYAGKELVHSLKAPAGRHCSSYVAELTALRDALRFLARDPDGRVPRGAAIRLCTDSRAAVVRLAAGASAQRCLLAREVWRGITEVTARHGARLTFQWVCAHVD